MSLYEIDTEQQDEMVTFAEANDAPIVMVNLMQVREHAIYPEDMPGDLETTPCSGREAMRRYSEASAGVRAASGASLVWRGDVGLLPIAAAEDRWNLVALVRYPSARAYLDMRATPEYQAARLHRRAALEDSRLFMCLEGNAPAG